MRRERGSRIRRPNARTLDLPSPFRLVMLREVGDAFAHAAELGAGTLVFVGRFDLAEFAVVLEPDEPLASARRAFYAGMVALGDALAAAARRKFARDSLLEEGGFEPSVPLALAEQSSPGPALPKGGCRVLWKGAGRQAYDPLFLFAARSLGEKGKTT